MVVALRHQEKLDWVDKIVKIGKLYCTSVIALQKWRCGANVRKVGHGCYTTTPTIVELLCHLTRAVVSRHQKKLGCSASRSIWLITLDTTVSISLKSQFDALRFSYINLVKGYKISLTSTIWHLEFPTFFSLL